MNIDVIQPYVTLIKDILTGLAALTAAVIGIIGLQTWKRQLTANSEHQLARRVLVAVYKVRDAILLCRVIPVKDGDEEGFEITKQLHDERVAELEKVRGDLEVELLEADAVWGYEEAFFLIVSLAMELEVAYEDYYSDGDYISKEEKARASSILFNKQYPALKDKFSVQVMDAVTQIEDILRPKLTLKRGMRTKRRWLQIFKRKKK